MIFAEWRSLLVTNGVPYYRYYYNSHYYYVYCKDLGPDLRIVFTRVRKEHREMTQSVIIKEGPGLLFFPPNLLRDFFSVVRSTTQS